MQELRAFGLDAGEGLGGGCRAQQHGWERLEAGAGADVGDQLEAVGGAMPGDGFYWMGA